MVFMMKKSNEVISNQMTKYIDSYSNKIIDLYCEKYPIIKFDPMQEKVILEDIKWNLNFLSAAVLVESEQLYFNYIQWFAKMKKNMKVPIDEILLEIHCIREVLKNEISYKNIILDQYIDMCLKSFVEIYNDEQDNNINIKIDEFLGYLLNFQKEKAIKYILDKIKNNVDISEIYIDYIQGALYKIGDLWMNGQISVAKEHYCSAVIQHIISLIYPYLFKNRTRNGRTLFAVSAGSELHEIGIRMVTDFFELDGWDTVYLGSNIVVNDVVVELEKRTVDLLAISVTIGSNIGFAIDLINKVKSKKIKVIVGGRVFNENKDLWKKIGADGYGESCFESVKVANSLFKD